MIQAVAVGASHPVVAGLLGLGTAGIAGVVVAMALLGLVATWIPAQRALSVNPLILLRED